MPLIDYFRNPDFVYDQYTNFFRDLCTDAEAIRTFAQAVNLRLAQVDTYQQERVALMSIMTALSFRRRHFRPIRFLESEVLTGAAITYGSGRVYGDGLVYGQGQQAAVALPLDRDIRDIQAIVNQITDPTLILKKDTDYVVGDGQIIFARNPFEDPRITYESRFDGIDDREILIWGVELDEHDGEVFNRYGTIVDMPDNRESNYADTVEELWKLMLMGGAIGNVRSVLTASAGIEATRSDGEVVELVDSASQDALIIATDKHAYRFSKSANPLVQVGDTLSAGQELADTIQVRSLNGANPNLSGIPALVMGPDTANISGQLSFENTDVQVVDVTYNGIPDVEFRVVGDAPVVTQFWDMVHRNGIESGTALRDIIISIYGSTDTTINPARFLVDHLLFGNAVLVITKPEQFLSTTQIASNASEVMARFLPPRILRFSYTFFEDGFESYDSDQFDEVAFFAGLDTIETSKEVSAASTATELAFTDLEPQIRQYPG